MRGHTRHSSCNMNKEVLALTQLELSKVFANEASCFTPWLKDNIEILKNDIGFNSISITETERKSENFRVDMIGYVNDVEEQRLVIENQFGDSNHDHLGKIITYSAEHGVKWAVWIVENARSEHIKAVESLNIAFQNIGFFLVEAKIYQISESRSGIKFIPIVKPKNINSVSASDDKLSKFWNLFLSSENKSKCQLISKRYNNSGNFIDLIGGEGYSYKISVAKNDVKICLVLNADDGTMNEEKRKRLLNRKGVIEEELGQLDWDYGWSGTRTKTIAKILQDGGYENECNYSLIISNSLEQLNKFRQVFDEQLKSIK